MDNFDKILKQKIEQFPFEYDPSDWNGVLQKQKSASVGFSKFTKILFSVFLLLFIASAVFYCINIKGEQLLLDDAPVAVNGDLLSVGGGREITNKQIGNKQLVNNVENFHVKKEQVLENAKKEKISEFLKSKVDLQTVSSINETAGKEIAHKKIVEKKIAENQIDKTEIVEKKIADKEVGEKDNKEGLSSELTVNGVVQNNENLYQQSAYIPENQAVVLGEARMKSNYSFAVLKKSLDHYLSISQIGLERARDIVVHLNNQFLNDASLSGFEGRYTLSSSINVAAITENIDELNHIPFEFVLANSFPIKSKQMGVGIAFQQIRGTNYNTLLFNVSIAKQFTLSRNNTLLIGGGINTSSIDKLDMVGPDYPWTQSPNLINKENQLLSLNLGMRFIHKSIYASISTSSLYRYAFTKDIHNSINPFTLHFATGGRLRLNGKWSINPSVNYNFIAYNSHSYLTPYFSFSKQNKIYFGVHSENFNSVGAHFGFQAFQRLDCYMRAGYSLNEELKSLYGPIHYTEIGIKLGIGQFQK
ncbi:MAG: type IX secretion system membrane protein PorP/SprF [Bacteroidales bacterium]|nr:type IX secretion system membrane protein PorP/SprF [Bacteroidales bacterium]